MKEFVANAKAPVKHLFNDHEWCHEDWCWAKGLQNQAHKFVCKIASTSAVTAAPTCPPATATGGDGVQMPSTTEVITPAVANSSEESYSPSSESDSNSEDERQSLKRV